MAEGASPERLAAQDSCAMCMQACVCMHMHAYACLQMHLSVCMWVHVYVCGEVGVSVFDGVVWAMMNRQASKEVCENA